MDISQITEKSLQFLSLHATGETKKKYGEAPISGEFALHVGQNEPDLYGMMDAVYILYTLGKLVEFTNSASRNTWAERILECQDEDGWFSKKNHRGHSREHATAYAIGALRLLEAHNDERYVDRVKPLSGLLPLLTDKKLFLQWIRHLDFRLSPTSILQKKLGWHYIWRASHVGGGIAAALHMTSHLLPQWWPGQVDAEEWFAEYFTWLNTHVSSTSGYWQRAFWNIVYRKPTLIDMGGAVHFFWVYGAMEEAIQFPEKVIESTISLQKSSGLYKEHPFCIDLDGNYCIIRPYLQLAAERQKQLSKIVYQSIEHNFKAVATSLLTEPFTDIYTDSHGLPGALVALVECGRLPEFKYRAELSSWQHPLDQSCWL